MAKTNRISKSTCPHCGGFARHNQHWDAYFCRVCDIWISKQCGVTPEKYGSREAALKQCFFACWERPKYPSGTKE